MLLPDKSQQGYQKGSMTKIYPGNNLVLRCKARNIDTLLNSMPTTSSSSSASSSSLNSVSIAATAAANGGKARILLKNNQLNSQGNGKHDLVQVKWFRNGNEIINQRLINRGRDNVISKFAAFVNYYGLSSLPSNILLPGVVLLNGAPIRKKI